MCDPFPFRQLDGVIMMKSVVFLFVVLLNSENILCKSFQPRENDFFDDELEVKDRWIPKVESEDNVIWKRIDVISTEGSLANKEEGNLGNDFFTQKPTNMKIDEDVVDQEIASESKNITLKKQPFSDNSLGEILDGQSTIPNGSDLNELIKTSGLVELEQPNLANAIVIDFSNITGDAIVIDALNENANSEEDLDEVSEMTKGEEISFLHEMPTSSFEFLIDAQTRRNILLKELLGSQTIFSVEEENTETPTLNEHDHSLQNIDLHSNENKLKDQITNRDRFLLQHISEVEAIAREEGLDETTQTFADAEQRDSSENTTSECPQPGWCIFWFLSQDTCAVNSHCLGSRICCKIGCSKTCIHV